MRTSCTNLSARNSCASCGSRKPWPGSSTRSKPANLFAIRATTMQTYKAPLRDMRFVLHELHDSASLSKLPGLEDMGPDLFDSVLEEAAKFVEEVLLPLNMSGDEEGCRLENGVVRTPKGFREAYTQFREAGWTAVGGDPRFGGQGLPESVGKLFEEMMCAANVSFALYPGLSFGAYRAISVHGAKEQQELYLPKLVDGTWSG